jgi:hypothetical protein
VERFYEVEGLVDIIYNMKDKNKGCGINLSITN